MVCFFKRLDTFATFGQADVTEFSVPLASSGGNTGTITVIGELTQAYTRQWLIMQGRIWYTAEVNPDNGLTHITVADPLAAFGRTLVYSTPATNILGEYIKDVAEAEYINPADTAYDMPYLTVTNSDTTTFTPVAPEDGLFSLESLMRDAQARGLFLTFDFDANGLSLIITPGDTTEHPVVVGDGHTQLISETYAQTAIAKVTVISDLGYPHDYYLSIDGTISTTPPVNRASGEWVTVKQGEDNLLDTATAVFAENIQSHKIEFYSDIQLDLYAHVNVRLNGKVYASQITYVGIMSRDSRYLYRCGELATTLTEKVASASSKYITAEQAKGLAPVQSVNGKTGAVVLEASDVGALPDTYVAPVQSVNGETGAVVLGASDVGALPDTYVAPVQSVVTKTGDVTLAQIMGDVASTGPTTSYPSECGRFAVTANIFTHVSPVSYSGLLTIERRDTYQRHTFTSLQGEIYVGWNEGWSVAEPTIWNKVAGGIGNSVRQVFASTDPAGWYRLAVMNDQITSAVIHLHATGWWEEDLYILIGRNYVSSASPPSITIVGNTYNTRATQFRLNEISANETYLEAYITPTNAHQLTITPFLTGWNRAYAVPKALSSSAGTIYATINHTAGDTIETSGQISSKMPVAAGPDGTISVAAKTWATLRTLSLPAGTYLLEFGASFAANTSGYRYICIGTSAESSNAPYPASMKVAPANSGETLLSVHCLVQPTEQTTYYFNAYHTGSAALNVAFNHRYVKLA